ncbi:MAG TPA: hypothetical protein VGR73_16630 [Bryobacteraceae bacterium]|nr:hypothetical protein [Bryobacteraceae bacterium]
MLKGFAAWTIGVLAALILGAPFSRAQSAQASTGAAAPAPRHDISGTWTPARDPGDGIGGMGARDMPEDGKPEHQLPYTALAREKMKDYRPGNGARQNVPSQINDPAVIYCDPQGMPRTDLYELRTTQIVQTPLKVVILYEFSKLWRVIWADGRELPKDPDARWFGYSVGKWADDYTFVAQTSGVDERTWLDKGGRPHSDELHVEERFHRTSRDLLELTVTIDDPKMYTRPWVALDKFPMKAMPADYDVPEMMCSVSEYMQYNKGMGFGNPTVGTK